MSPEAERIVKRMGKLSPADLCAVHREACRLVQPFYFSVYRSSWEAGVAASRAKQKRGYDKWRPQQSAMWERIRATT